MSTPCYSPGSPSEVGNCFVDPGIPALQSILDPYQLVQHLNPCLSASWGALLDLQIKVLRHHRARRCTVDITLETETGRRELIGKVYDKDRSDVYLAMKRITQAGFDAGTEFSIPQPIAFLPKLGLLLQEKVQGVQATEIFLTGNERERARAAERCASWLAHFQTHAPQLGPVFVLKQQITEYWVSRLAKSVESLAGKARLLFERLQMAAPALNGTEMCSGHGDYCHHQIILTVARTATLDWDHYCVADPARDLAKFIINLKKLALKSLDSINALDVPIEVFNQTYMSRSGFDIRKRLTFYKAAHCLKVARFDAESESSCTEKTEAMLDEGLRILVEEG